MILTLCPNPSVDKRIELDSFRTGHVNRSLREAAWPGGKGVHVALAVRELGLESRLIGFWGGPTGRWIRDRCEEAGVRCHGPQTDTWTRTCLTIVTPQEETELRERGPAVGEKLTEQFLEEVEQLLPEAKALCVSGSWPEGVPDGIYMQLRNLLAGSDIPFWIDASGRRLREAIRARPYGIHINRHEAAELFGRDVSPQDGARQLLDYCRIAAVTDGANGLYLAGGETLIHAQCRVDRVMTTVGCGDCLLAGLIAEHQAGSSPSDQARTAVAAGSANCLTPRLGIIRRGDVEKLKQDVKLELLK